MTTISDRTGPGDPGATPAADAAIALALDEARAYDDAKDALHPFAFGYLSSFLRDLDRYNETPRQYAERVGLIGPEG